METKAIMVLSTARTGSNHFLSVMQNFTNVDVNWEIFGKNQYFVKNQIFYQIFCQK